MTRRRILYLLDTLEVGGTERSTLEIAARLRHYRPLVVHAYRGASLAPRYAAAGVPIRSLELSDDAPWWQRIARLQDVVREFAPAILHSALFRSDMLARALAPRPAMMLVNALVNDSYGPARDAITRGRQRTTLAGVRFLDRVTAPVVDRFFANSHAIARSHEHALGIEARRIVVIPRGRDVTAFVDRAELHIRARTRASLGIRDDEVMLLNVARLIERKGHLELLDALAMLRSRRLNVRLCIAGDGPARASLHAHAEALGVSTHVQLLGSRDDVTTLLAAADVFVFPSHYEGFPGALIEAMMAAVPIVASDIPMNREALGPFASSTPLFAVGEAGAIAAAIEVLCSHAEVARGRARDVAAFARAAYAIEAVATAHEAEYDRMLDERPRRDFP